ncbi:MAG: hypothetical protein M0Z77_04900 [Thermoplasmatales archaeon]|nr:hypothetical protein [Candidatus Thermoplasmatota archaeon]MCL6002066.1 hypothetical protein [Candidatus Thermoplasmatota archaeon]MDA8054973.1 hypothetical protein [Thermoplasmatales archaeon]
MKINSSVGFVVSLVIVVALGLALLYTGIWYLVLFSGLVAALVVRKGYLISTLSGFLGGLVAILVVFLSLPYSHIGALMSEVGAIAGISSFVLIALMFLINGGLCVSGALIGTFITGVIRKN